VEPTVLKLWLWVVPCSRRSWVVLLLPMVNPMPPVLAHHVPQQRNANVTHL
jgi:hypothetical protein